MKNGCKLIVIGWDGATFRVLQPLIDAGVMPTLARLMRAGASGILRSTQPPVTCPAWPTMFTGVNAGKHGVFSFIYRDPENDQVRTASSGDVQAPKIWELIGEAGKQVGILNVPITFPAQAVNGVMMTGFVSPEESPRVTWPTTLGQDLRARFDDLSLNWPVLHYRPSDPTAREGHIRRVNDLMRLRNAEFDYILNRFDVDFCFLVHEYTDRVNHLFYHILDPSCKAHGSPANRAALKLLCDGFFELDQALGRLVEHFGQDANYILVSDHGFDAVARWVYVNNLLEQHDLLAIRGFKALAEVITRKGRMPTQVRSWLGLEQREPWHRQDPFRAPLLDYAQTKAFAGPQLEHAVYVNVKGRCPEGIVEPGDEYERVKREIIEALSAATDPLTGDRVFEGAWPREELYNGQYLENAPDVVYELAPGYMVSNATLPRALLGKRFLRGLRPGWNLSGYHRPEGIFIGSGPAFRRIEGLELSIVDIAPTVLYLMDLPIPTYMDGRIAVESLRPELLRLRPPRTCASDPWYKSTGETAYTAEEQMEVTRRLEALGYL